MNEIEYKKISNLVADFYNDKPLLKEEVKDYSLECYKLANNLTNLKKLLVLYGYELVDMMIFKNYATVLHTETNEFYRIQIETN